VGALDGAHGLVNAGQQGGVGLVEDVTHPRCSPLQPHDLGVPRAVGGHGYGERAVLLILLLLAGAELLLSNLDGYVQFRLLELELLEDGGLACYPIEALVGEGELHEIPEVEKVGNQAQQCELIHQGLLAVHVPH